MQIETYICIKWLFYIPYDEYIQIYDEYYSIIVN